MALKRKNLKINRLVRSVDISPTILEIINSEIHFNEIDGESLLTKINNEQPNDGFGFIENTPIIQKKANLVIGIRTTKYKYFRDISNPLNRVHLFNLEKDEYEDNNISTTRPDLVEKMEKYISKINYEISSDSKIPDKKETKIIKDELRKLGYE